MLAGIVVILMTFDGADPTTPKPGTTLFTAAYVALGFANEKEPEGDVVKVTFQ